MTLKPGMHQIVETKKVNFDAIVAKMVDAQPQITYPMVGWGKKFFIKATLKRKTGEKVEVEFFTELTFSECPRNRDLGYTAEDSTITQGVSILDYDRETKTGRGEMLTYADFVENYIQDSTTRTILDRVMENMREHMTVNEQTIEKINNAWGNRDPGEKNLYSVQYQ